MQGNDQNIINKPIPEWKLKLSYFYANHRTSINRALVFFLFFADIIIVILFTRIFLNYQTSSIETDRQMRSMSINLINHEVVKKNSPQPLDIIETNIIENANGKYDLLAAIANNNDRWAITELSYAFKIDGQAGQSKETFILPKSVKYLTAFNVPAASQAELQILGIKWKRITDFTLLSFTNSIKVTNASYVPLSVEGQSAGQVILDVANTSPYDFWEVGLVVVLYDQQKSAIGLDYIALDKLLVEEKRQVKINWIDKPLGNVYHVAAYPEVNLLNMDAIMKIDSPIGSPAGLE